MNTQTALPYPTHEVWHNYADDYRNALGDNLDNELWLSGPHSPAALNQLKNSVQAFARSVLLHPRNGAASIWW